MNAILADWHTAPINEKVRKVLGLLEKVTLAPATIEPDDITPLRDAGISDQAIEDALNVCAYFNVIDRIADALNFSVPPLQALTARAHILLEHGYQQSIRPEK